MHELLCIDVTYVIQITNTNRVLIIIYYNKKTSNDLIAKFEYSRTMLSKIIIFKTQSPIVHCNISSINILNHF